MIIYLFAESDENIADLHTGGFYVKNNKTTQDETREG